MEVKPYQDPTKYYTPVHNVLFDVIMPDLKPTSFKVLCLIFRKTHGWHKSTDDISFSQIKAGTGIKSNHTIIAALKELTEKDHILVISHEGQWQSNGYAINIDFTMIVPEDEPPSAKNAPEESEPPSAKNAPSSGVKNAPGSSAKNAHTKDMFKNTIKNKEEAAKKTAAPASPVKPVKKKPVTKKKPDKKPVPPAVEAYREQFRRYPNKSVWPDIEREIGAEEGALIKWRETLEAWRLSGNKPTNFVGLFDWFNNGIPEYAKRKNGGGQNGRSKTKTNYRGSNRTNGQKKNGGSQLWPMPEERVAPSQLIKRIPVAEPAASGGD